MTFLALVEPVPATAESARLSGIIIVGEERLALFILSPIEGMTVLHEGDLVGNERIVGIGARSVRLEGPSGQHIVCPGDDPVSRASLASIVPPPPLIDPYRRERELENDQ